MNGKTFPSGQCSADILNLDSPVLTELDRRIGKLMLAVKNLFREKTDSNPHSTQELLNAVWDWFFTLPVYRNLKEQTERGELSDEEFRRQLETL